MNVTELLSLGSVVSLKDADKKVMIIGIKQFSEKENIIKDYIGVMYPEGYINRDIFFTFNHEDIAEQFFSGYQTEEQKEFLEQVEKILMEKK